MRLKDRSTCDDCSRTVCHSRHHPENDAHRLIEARDGMFVVETISLTSGDGEHGETADHNMYFALGMADAIGLAALVEIQGQQTGKMVVAIRQATESEQKVFHCLFADRIEQHDTAFSGPQVRRLAEQEHLFPPDRGD